MFPLALKIIEITVGRAIKTFSSPSSIQSRISSGYLILWNFGTDRQHFLKNLGLKRPCRVSVPVRAFPNGQSQCFLLQFKPTTSQWGPFGHKEQVLSPPLQYLYTLQEFSPSPLLPWVILPTFSGVVLALRSFSLLPPGLPTVGCMPFGQ